MHHRRYAIVPLTALLLAVCAPDTPANRPATPEEAGPPDQTIAPPVGEPDASTQDTAVRVPDTSAEDTFPDFEASAQVDEQARQRGVAFRAVGQEPGWLLEIDQERITLLTDYATDTLVTAVPRPTTDQGTRTTVYRAATDDQEVRITIRVEPCVDVMSGQGFPATVTVVLNGVEYRGCGRSL
jgi:uncharacterized membrane protein